MWPIRLFYWLGARFDSSLVLQAVLMIGVQLLLLHVALTHRPSTSNSHNQALHTPFGGMEKGKVQRGRPYDFWQWRSARPYWSFLAYLTLGLAGLELVLGRMPGYSQLLGYVALAVEATLPLPQMVENQRKRSCRGFRPSVLGNWLLGDVMKMVFFFNARGSVPWAFKLCGLFQFVCDIFLGVQYWMYGDGVGSAAEDEKAKEVEKNGHSL